MARTFGMTKEEIEQNTIYLMLRGSQAYGTNTAESDEDVGGICMPSKDVLFGVKKFEQDDEWFDENGVNTDKVVYVFDKSLDLMLANNPNMLDFLFVPERCVLKTSPTWERIKAIRDSFISMESKKAFQGYAIAQLGRIMTHRGYLLNPVGKPDRELLGLPAKSIFPQTQYESIARLSAEYVPVDLRDPFYNEMAYLMDTEGSFIVKKYVDIENYRAAIELFKNRQGQFLRMLSSISGRFLAPEYRDMAVRELKYLTQLEQWKSYSEWESKRNEKRKILERKCGFDSKHGAHLTRLLRMGVEILEGKGVLVDRTNIDAQELLAIRQGEYSFDQVIALSKPLNDRADFLFKAHKCANDNIVGKPEWNLNDHIKEIQLNGLNETEIGKSINIALRAQKIFDEGKVLPERPDYAKVNELRRELLDEWGRNLLNK